MYKPPQTHACQTMLPFHCRFLPLFFVLTFLSPPSTNADPCTNEFASKFNISRHCLTHTLGVQFAWSFNQTSRRLQIAFGSQLTSENGWLAWGLNPTGRHMIGTQAIIGIKLANGTIGHHLYDVTDYTKTFRCQLLPDDNAVSRRLGIFDFNFTYDEDIQYYVIRATLSLPKSYNASQANIIWQIGNAAAESSPEMHPTSLKHLSTAETINLVDGRVISASPHLHSALVTVHGTLNIAGWGTFLPIGVIISRYFRKFPFKSRSWFRFHIGCQFAGYILGTTGWAIGMYLGKNSKYYTFPVHRILGIIIFTFTTIQMLALVLKPPPDDKFRAYWNMYHHSLGYSLLVLTSINIFVGIGIVAMVHAWKWAYIGVLAGLGGVVLVFEGSTWLKFLLSGNR